MGHAEPEVDIVSFVEFSRVCKKIRESGAQLTGNDRVDRWM